LDAKNSEVHDSCEVANALDFIKDKDQIVEFDDSAAALKKEMEDNKVIITELIGQKKFDEEIELLEKLVKSEAKGGKFIAKEGDVDTRE